MVRFLLKSDAITATHCFNSPRWTSKQYIRAGIMLITEKGYNIAGHMERGIFFLAGAINKMLFPLMALLKEGNIFQ